MNKPKPKPSRKYSTMEKKPAVKKASAPAPKNAPKKKNVMDMSATEYQKMLKKKQAEYEKMVAAAMKRREKTKRVWGAGVE